jgi:hypothetical protein
MSPAFLAVIRFRLGERRLILTWSATRPLSERYCIPGARQERPLKRIGESTCGEALQRFQNVDVFMSRLWRGYLWQTGGRFGQSSREDRTVEISQAWVTLVHGQCLLNNPLEQVQQS